MDNELPTSRLPCVSIEAPTEFPEMSDPDPSQRKFFMHAAHRSVGVSAGPAALRIRDLGDFKEEREDHEDPENHEDVDGHDGQQQD